MKTKKTIQTVKQGLILLGLVMSGITVAAQDLPDRSHLPMAVPTYSGQLAPTVEKSKAQYPPAKAGAPKGAPNVLLVMTDDVGFAASSTFGGLVPTPNLDRLAAGGLRFNQFHTTAICSPTRAALLTGRNHHAVATGTLVELRSPFPGYYEEIPDSAATIAEILRLNGYSTAMFGKDHNTPGAERSPSGPYDNWPTGRGFDYFYGFLAGDTNQFKPALVEGNQFITDAERPNDYILDRDLIDHSIHWLHQQKAVNPDKPFFIYLAPGTAHAPHQAPRDWIDKFKGQFDGGWDQARELILARQKTLGVVPENTELAARPDPIPAWNTLSTTEQKVYARFMEVYAGMLAFQDDQFGRLMAEIDRMGLAENTLVIFIEGDNGGSAEGGATGSLNELADLSSAKGHRFDTQWLAKNLDILGGPETYQTFPGGWAFATNTPFPWVKQLASHLGGVRNGLVVSWPSQLQKPGEVRSQYHHVIDILPTILEAAGIPAPKTVAGVEQQPINGVSMLYSFNNAQAKSKRTTQYYEIMGNRAIYHDGWLANTQPRNMPWDMAHFRPNSDVMSYPWELYNLNDDFSQSKNLAQEMPDKLAQMQSEFDRQARANQVYPIHDSGGNFRAAMAIQAQGKFKSHYEYWGPDISVGMLSSPPIFNLPFVIEADIDVPKSGADGVILAAGSQFGGWSFYLDNNRPVVAASISPQPGEQTKFVSKKKLAPGNRRVRFELQKSKAGNEMIISVDGQETTRATLSVLPYLLAGGGETMDIGRDLNDPVVNDYPNGGNFTGKINKVTVDVQLPSLARGASN